MSKNEMIKRATMELGLIKNELFTVEELETIAKNSGCQLYEVMFYLKKVRRVFKDDRYELFNA